MKQRLMGVVWVRTAPSLWMDLCYSGSELLTKEWVSDRRMKVSCQSSCAVSASVFSLSLSLTVSLKSVFLSGHMVSSAML